MLVEIAMQHKLLIVATLALAVVVRADGLPLVAGKLTTGPSSQVELRNTGNKAVTAWSLGITTHPEASRIHRVIHTGDAYLAEVTRDLPRSSPHLDWIRPGQSKVLPLDPQPAEATVEVMAVVLEDGTALGEPQILKSIFDKRVAERDELHKVVDIFNAVLPAKRGAAALDDLKSRLAAPAGAEESTPHRSAREAVDAFSQKAAGGNADQADQSLRTYAAFVQRQYEVAAKHAARR
jgi:hypothetical protein